MAGLRPADIGSVGTEAANERVRDAPTGGGLEGLRARLRDAEERLEAAQRALFETEAKYTALLEQLPCAIYIDEPDAHGTTLYMSPQVEDLLGISPEEYINSAAVWEQWVHPDDRERMSTEYEDFLETGQPETGEYRFRKPDGTTVWVHDR